MPAGKSVLELLFLFLLLTKLPLAQTGKFCRKKGYDMHHELYDLTTSPHIRWSYVLFVTVNTIRSKEYVGQMAEGSPVCKN